MKQCAASGKVVCAVHGKVSVVQAAQRVFWCKDGCRPSRTSLACLSHPGWQLLPCDGQLDEELLGVARDGTGVPAEVFLSQQRTSALQVQSRVHLTAAGSAHVSPKQGNLGRLRRHFGCLPEVVHAHAPFLRSAASPCLQRRSWTGCDPFWPEPMPTWSATSPHACLAAGLLASRAAAPLPAQRAAAAGVSGSASDSDQGEGSGLAAQHLSQPGQQCFPRRSALPGLAALPGLSPQLKEQRAQRSAHRVPTWSATFLHWRP